MYFLFLSKSITNSTLIVYSTYTWEQSTRLIVIYLIFIVCKIVSSTKTIFFYVENILYLHYEDQVFAVSSFRKVGCTLRIIYNQLCKQYVLVICCCTVSEGGTSKKESGRNVVTTFAILILARVRPHNS